MFVTNLTFHFFYLVLITYSDLTVIYMKSLARSIAFLIDELRAERILLEERFSALLETFRYINNKIERLEEREKHIYTLEDELHTSQREVRRLETRVLILEREVDQQR